MSRKYYPYINGLKGIACIGVMVGHYFGLFLFMESASFQHSAIVKFLLSPFGVFCDANFWLYLFFICSGYLLASASVYTLADLASNSIKRLLRLGLPVFFSSVGVFLLLTVFGPQNQATVEFFSNSWFQSSYSPLPTIVSVIRSPFDVLILGDKSINSPFWVLKDMLIVSILIYGIIYLSNKFKAYRYAKYIIYYIGLILTLFQSNVVISCYMGMAIQLHSELIQKIVSRMRWLCVLALLLIYFVYGFIRHGALAMLFFLVFIAVIPYFPRAAQWLGNPFLLQINSISFGIYSMHWPVYCTAAALILIQTTPFFGISHALTFTFVCYVILSVLAGWVFSATAEPVSRKLVRILSDRIGLLLHSSENTRCVQL